MEQLLKYTLQFTLFLVTKRGLISTSNGEIDIDVDGELELSEIQNDDILKQKVVSKLRHDHPSKFKTKTIWGCDFNSLKLITP